MKTYIVGGAVRDGLLGLPVQDRDHVVIGATPEEMLKQGYTPVGKDFPVFLHPLTHEEYALARTERKTAPGYKGFVFHAAPDVTLEEDLVRRDLTINAMARAEDGSLVDPFGGRHDLQKKVFRHVSAAFAEDPLRILRVARFAARFADFKVAPETNLLMRQMVQAGEVNALVAERVWQEMGRGLMEQKPSRMFEVLRDCDALQHILPELDTLWGKPSPNPQICAGVFIMAIVDSAAAMGHALPIRFAALTHKLDEGVVRHEKPDGDLSTEESGIALINAMCKRLKIPNDCRHLAVMSARECRNIQHALGLHVDAVVALLERCDAFRKPQRFADMLKVFECVHGVREGSAEIAFPPSQHLQAALTAAQSINAGNVASVTSQHFPGQPERIAQAVRDARIAAVSASLGK